MPNSELTARQAEFCRQYLIDLNAKQAAIRAGFSAKTAEAAASRLLRNVKVAARLKIEMEKRSTRTGINADQVLNRLNDIGDVDIARCYDANGHLLPIHDIPIEVRKSIASIKVFEEFEGFGKDRVKVGEVREVKFWDKLKANELLGKNLKLFTEKVEHSGRVTLETLVAPPDESDE